MTGIAAGTVDKKNLLSLTSSLYLDYGKSVVEDRALVDYRDGLKPVARRLLWSMFNMGLRYNSPYVKAARVVGDTLGRFHPHGDQACYNAMVTLANLSHPLVDGEGNWGNLIDGPAHYRYTEARLTKYAQLCMMQPEYLAVTPMVPNYDGKDKEPLYLPALLPNVLLNGAYGIAVGVTGVIPPIHMETLMPLIEKHIGGTPITTKMLRKRLRFNYKFSTNQLDDDDERLTTWLENGQGSLRFMPDYQIDYRTRTINITGVPFYFNWDSAVERLADLDFVSGFENFCSFKNGDKIHFAVRLKNTVNMDDVDGLIRDKIVPIFARSVSTATNITLRHSANNVEFRSLTIPNLLGLWTDYRVDLEKRAQDYIMGVLSGHIARQELMLLAVNNRKVIIEALDANDPKAVLVKKLKITEEQAKEILELRVMQLSRLNGDEIQKAIEKLRKDRKLAKSRRDDPGPKVMSDLNEAMKLAA